jgi:hypothetical protein
MDQANHLTISRHMKSRKPKVIYTKLWIPLGPSTLQHPTVTDWRRKFKRKPDIIATA